MTRFIRSKVGIAGVFGVLATLLLMVAPALAQSAEKPRAPEMFRPVTTHDSVQLKWWETADPAVLGISYEVQRRQGVGSYSVINGSYGNYTHYQDGTVGIPFTDSSVSPDTSYAYRVYAIQGGLRSDSPSRASVRTKPAPGGVVEPVRTPEPTSETTVEPAQETTTELTPEPTAEPAQETTPEPTSETTVEPAQETTTEPTSETTVEPAQETTTATQNDGGKQQLQDQDDNSDDDAAVHTNEAPSKIEDIDGDEEARIIESPGVTRSETTSTSIMLRWTAPAAPLQGALATPTGYRIWQTSGEVFDRSTTDPYRRPDTATLSNTGVTDTERMITGLTANTLYHFWVAALYGIANQGAISQRMSIRTDPANNAPSRVRNLEAEMQENGDVRVTWDGAERGGVCYVDKHVVTKSSLGGDRGTADIANLLTHDWAAADIRASDYYSFSVTPYCGTVAGEWRTTYLETGAATGELPVPQLFLPKSTSTSVELKWYTATDPAVENFEFEVQRRNMANPEWAVVDGIYPSGDDIRTTFDSGGFRFIFQDHTVSPYSLYTYRVFAKKINDPPSTIECGKTDDVCGESSMKISALTLVAEASGGTPGAPVNVRWGLVLSSPKAVRLMWDPPTNTGGSAITGYRITKFVFGTEDGEPRVTDTGSTATTYDDTDLNDDRSSTNSEGHEDASGIDPDGTYYFYKVIAINSQGPGVASELLTAQWTHHPRPGVTVHTRPARTGTTSAEAEITNGATDSTIAVTWTDGAAATRQCHTDYTLVYGYKDTWDGSYVYELPPPTVTVDTTAIVIANTWRIMSNAGPYARRIGIHSDRVWEAWAGDTQEASAGKELLDWSVKVYCGHPTESDSVEIAEALPTISGS